MKFKGFKIIFWLFALGAFLFAQNYSLSLTTNFDPNRSVNWNLAVEINGIQNGERGIALSFPASRNFVPVQIKSGDRSYWLKEADTYPDSDRVIHWEKTDSLMILRFAQNFSAPAGKLTVFLNLANEGQRKTNGKLKLMALLAQGRLGAILSQIEFQIKQSVTR
ncbi:hypothetical protein [Caldithrix abyssi]|uniref:Uncharacterized protein n=1 Tax=Caldithrix abyssi DSM 13497 TaxID=880073 RepID=H1XSU7_CALAY|nr:hypothetical protein [Caldithrix abyssi]APF20273.1 hypothetical protein Cabys_3527 [Caldithrix abyssi DSM 13497]EHO40324.1 hypothetical protein Calab_0684 [Caldithrix abyssi DSM 13497]